MNCQKGITKTLFLQIQCWILPLWIIITVVTSQSVKEPAELNECERGVKRHHPSQANLYQIFTRKDYRKQWLDYACPEYMIFDPRTCECTETQRPTEAQGQITQRTSSKSQNSRQPSSGRRETPPSTQYSEKIISKGRSRESGAQQNSWGGDSKQGGTWDKEDSRQDSGQDNRQDSRQDNRQDSRQESRQENSASVRKSDSRQRPQSQGQARSWTKQESYPDTEKQDNRDSNIGWGKQERNSAGKQERNTAPKPNSWVSQESAWDNKKDSSVGKTAGSWRKQEPEQKKLSSRSLKAPENDWDRDNEINPGSPSVAKDKASVGYEESSKKQDGILKKQSSWSSDRENEVTEPIGQRTSGGDCHLHRPSTEGPSHFERWTEGKWLPEDCNWPFYTGLVWSQASCRCEWGPNRTHVTPLTGENVPATCLLMLKISFDGGNIVDEGRHIWLNIKDRENAEVETDKTAVGGKCGSFRGSSIAIPYFKSNVLGATFHVGFMFKLCAGDPDTDIPLLHNDCIESPDPPSIVIVYQAWKKRVVISMRTMDSEELTSEFCVVENTQTQWVKLDITFVDNVLEVSANNEICINSDKFAGPVATNNCPLTLLGEAFCGKLDEVVISRGCSQGRVAS